MSELILPSGAPHPSIFIPRQHIDPAFSRWIRERFGPEMAVGWDPERRRFVVGAYDYRVKQRVVLVVIETKDGEFLPLGDEAKALVLGKVVHDRRYRVQHKQSKQRGRELKQEDRKEWYEYFEDQLKDNKRQIFGEPVVAVLKDLPKKKRRKKKKR